LQNIYEIWGGGKEEGAPFEEKAAGRGTEGKRGGRKCVVHLSQKIKREGSWAAVLNGKKEKEELLLLLSFEGGVEKTIKADRRFRRKRKGKRKGKLQRLGRLVNGGRLGVFSSDASTKQEREKRGGRGRGKENADIFFLFGAECRYRNAFAEFFFDLYQEDGKKSTLSWCKKRQGGRKSLCTVI